MAQNELAFFEPESGAFELLAPQLLAQQQA
jgi:hypothetical protein